MSLTNEQIEEVEDLFQLRYSELVIEVHQLLEDACQGYNLYERGHPWDLTEFFKDHSSAIDEIAMEVDCMDQKEKDDSDDFNE
jgi:hypothetical protein